MTNDEANKIIAEYMGTELNVKSIINYAGPETTYNEVLNSKYESISKWYSESLDALVPVWMKIKNEANTCKDICMFLYDEGVDFSISDNGWNSSEHSGTVIQEAAAIGTAKAIRDIK